MKLKKSSIASLIALSISAWIAHGMESKKPMLIAIFLDEGQESIGAEPAIYSYHKIPICQELSVYLKQCFCPILVSKVLLHSIIAYKQQFINDIYKKNSIAGIFVSKKEACSKKKGITLHYGSDTSEAPSRVHENLEKFLTQHPGTQFAYFSTTISFDAWNVYPTENDSGLYLLVPTTIPLINSTKTVLKPIPYSKLKLDALSSQAENKLWSTLLN